MMSSCHMPRKSSHSLTPAEEEYIESIYRLEKEIGKVKVNQLAKHLGVKGSSVVEMLRKLKDKHLIIYDRSGVKLTEMGMRRAAGIVRRHELAERLLTDVFKHSLVGVHEHACKFEHVIDDDLADKIDHVLGKPLSCPHGYPIPNPEGKTIQLRASTLAELAKGEECIVVAIPQERYFVQRLLSLNILPGAKVRVSEKLPRGAIMLQCGEMQIALSRNIASKIFVKTLAAP